MQYILQDFEDTQKLSEVLDRMGLEYSMHKVIPFVGELHPEPSIQDKDNVIMFGSYSLRHYATKHDMKYGVFTIEPYIHEEAWKPFILNADSIIVKVKDILSLDIGKNSHWFIRPVNDSKEIAGQIMQENEIEYMVKGVMSLSPDEYIIGSIEPETELMLSSVKKIVKEWRNWVIGGKVVTSSMYKEGSRVVYRQEIDEDALDFVKELVSINPCYSDAYVLDVCRTDDGKLHLLETNCINAAGFYAADLQKIIEGLETL